MEEQLSFGFIDIKSYDKICRFGNDKPFGSLGNIQSISPSYLLGSRIQIIQPVLITALGFISRSPSSCYVKAGLYSHSLSRPDTLLVQIPRTLLKVGVQEIDVTRAVFLEAGTYWFMAAYNSFAPIVNDNGHDNLVEYISHYTDDVLPEHYPASSRSYMGHNFNYYIVGIGI